MHSIESASPERWERTESQIESSEFWTRLIFREKIDSTSNFLRREGGLNRGVVVVAEAQTRGRGKGERAWISPRGGLWISALIDPLPRRLHQNLYVGILNGIKKVLHDYGVRAEISRPNDLVVGGKKIGGILVEENSRGIILGLGINVNNDPRRLPDGLNHQATSLRELTGEGLSLDELLSLILVEIEELTFQLKEGGQ